MVVKPLPVSVVIPTHNRPLLLRDAVASVRAQTELPDEIIVVDDGSSPSVDSSMFDGSMIPVRVVRNGEARGVAAARNVGVNHASGDFVAFVDDDDTWVPWKLEFVAACLSRHPHADVVIHQSGYEPSARTENQHCTALEDPLKRMLYEQPPHLTGVVVRRALHLDSPMDENFAAAEDLDYLIRLAKSGARMVESMAVLAVLGNAETSDIGMDQRIQGRLKLLTQHPEILSDRKAKAFFNIRLGHLQRRAGMRSSAFRSFLKAGGSAPSSPLVWKGFAHCLVPIPSGKNRRRSRSETFDDR